MEHRGRALFSRGVAALLSVGVLHCATTDDVATGAVSEGEALAQEATSSSPNRAAGYVNLAPPLGEPLPATGDPVTPRAPEGWVWYDIEGAICRDGSPAGFYVRYAPKSDQLLWYLEGGGACISPGFCGYNPKNADEVLAGDGQTALGSIGGAIAGRQQPGTNGIFNTQNAENPFKDWNAIYVPYCTGDVYFGTRRDVTLPGLAAKQQFVGHENMKKFVGRIVPTFKDKVKRVVLTGASAGGFGAVLNYSMVQDAFDTVPIVLLNDSAPSFVDKYLPTCMQQRWRTMWGFADSFPKDCKDCFQADGGNLVGILDFLVKKHPNFQGGIVSSQRDEIIRLFFSAGLNSCAGFETADPVLNFLAGIFPPEQYTAGLDDLKAKLAPTGRFASYFIAGPNHQHIWRPRFFTAATGNVSIAKWTTDLLNGKFNQIAP